MRIYTLAEAGPLPPILFIDGGGWVVATISTYDASARALTDAAQANFDGIPHGAAASVPGCPRRHLGGVAMVGDQHHWSEWLATGRRGGRRKRWRQHGCVDLGTHNFADGNVQMPVHQRLVYPLVDADTDSLPEKQNRAAAPQDTPSLTGFYDKYLPGAADRSDPR